MILIVVMLLVVFGVGNGIWIIFEWNIWFLVILLVVFIIFGLFKWLMSFFIMLLGDYFWNVILMGFWIVNEVGNVSW